MAIRSIKESRVYYVIAIIVENSMKNHICIHLVVFYSAVAFKLAGTVVITTVLRKYKAKP